MAESLPMSPDALQTYKRLLGYLRYYKGWFALGIVGASMYASVGWLIGLLTKEFVDGTFLERDPAMLTLTPIFVVLLFVLRGGGEFVQSYFMGQVSRRIVKRMRREVFDRYL